MPLPGQVWGQRITGGPRCDLAEVRESHAQRIERNFIPPRPQKLTDPNERTVAKPEHQVVGRGTDIFVANG